MRRFLLAILLLPHSLFAAEIELPLDNVQIVDGDTVVADVLMPWSVTLRKQVIRANDYDAWEASTARKTVNVTPAEIVKGKAAKADLAALVGRASSVVVVPSEKREAYGRRLGSLKVVAGGKSVNVADFMRERGHCRKED
jgi:hypothetical protein